MTVTYAPTVIALLGGKCEQCGFIPSTPSDRKGSGKYGELVVHHKDGNRGDNTPGNLQVLCRPCHLRVHRGRSPRAVYDRAEINARRKRKPQYKVMRIVAYTYPEFIERLDRNRRLMKPPMSRSKYLLFAAEQTMKPHEKRRSDVQRAWATNQAVKKHDKIVEEAMEKDYEGRLRRAARQGLLPPTADDVESTDLGE